MLISPLRTQRELASLITPHRTQGPHTALLILPQGQLLSSATAYNDYPEENSEEDANGGTDGSGDEPYLDDPERMRLLLGLASQWEEDESPRVECEVSPRKQTRVLHLIHFRQLGRLLLCPIPLPPTETPAPNAAIPVIRSPTVQTFVLVLNGSNQTPWNVMTAKVRRNS
jgi:hypothetical protein